MLKQRPISSKPRRKFPKGTQRGGCSNRYDFAYAGKHTVNQMGKITPDIIKKGSNEINNIAQRRINQIISQGGKEVERVLPKMSTKQRSVCSEILGNNS